MSRESRLNEQIQMAWDETIGPFINSIDDGCEEDLKGLTKNSLLETTYQNLISCHYQPGHVFIGSSANKDLKFASKETIMNKLQEMWDNDFQGDVSYISPFISA